MNGEESRAIHKFDPTSVSANSKILMIGKRDSDKYSVIKYILSSKRHKYDGVLAVVSSNLTKIALQSIMPENAVYDVNSSGGNIYGKYVIEHIMNTFNSVIHELSMKQDKPLSCLLIMDDRIYQNNMDVWKYANQFSGTFIFLTKYPKSMCLEMMYYFDYVISFYDPSHSMELRLWNFYYSLLCPNIKDYKDFESIVKYCYRNNDDSQTHSMILSTITTLPTLYYDTIQCSEKDKFTCVISKKFLKLWGTRIIPLEENSFTCAHSMRLKIKNDDHDNKLYFVILVQKFSIMLPKYKDFQMISCDFNYDINLNMLTVDLEWTCLGVETSKEYFIKIQDACRENGIIVSSCWIRHKICEIEKLKT